MSDVMETILDAEAEGQKAAETAASACEEAAEAVAEAAADAEKAAEAAAEAAADAAEAGSEAAAEAGKAGSEAAAEAGEAGSEAASKAAEAARDNLSNLAAVVGQALEAGKELVGQALEVGKELGGQALEVGKELGGQALVTGKDRAAKAADFLGTALESGKELAGDAAIQLSGKVEEAAHAVKEKMIESKEARQAAAQQAPKESMADYDEQITASFRPIHEGDLLTGTIIGISDDEIVLDFGTYTDGVIKLKDASDDPSFSFHQLEMGQEVTGTVIRRDNGEGRLQLSMKEATAVLAWDRLRKLMEDKTPIDVKISGIVKGGAVAYVEGIRGFIPASRLSLSYVEDLNTFLNQTLQVLVISVEEEDKRLVLSARELLREKEAEEKKKRISNVEVGLVTEGTVETIKPYGAFVSIGNGMSGLLHISQISNTRIKHPSVVLQEGQKVKVKIIGVKDGKISLSMKALEDVAAEEVTEETYELPKSEAATTSMASLLKNIKL